MKRGWETLRTIISFFAVLFVVNAAFSASCPAGFRDVTSNYPATFYSKNGDLCPTGYEPFSAPDTMVFKFNGLVLSDAPTPCSSGHYENGTCVPNAQDNCASGFYKNVAYQATFYSKNGGLCPTGYEPYTHDNGVSFIFNGLVLSNAPTVCASGYYVDGVCSSRPTTGCMAGYVDAGVDSVVSAILADGSCSSGYELVGSYSECTATTTSNLCTTLCNGGWLKTSAGFCSTACDAGFSALHVSNGLQFTAYGMKTTRPSLNIRGENGKICYINLSVGSGKNAINIRYNGTIYHTTD